ncbi:MAG: hypothetical protein AAFU73_20525 [Planctomycetota bacterium]
MFHASSIAARAAASLVLAASASAAAAQVTVTPLLRTADVLPTGETVGSISSASISENGSWAARCLLNGQAGIVRDGEAVLRRGDPFAGETIDSVVSASLTPDGALAALIVTRDATASFTPRIVLGQETLLKGDDAVTLPSTGQVRRVVTIDAFALEDGWLVVSLVFGGAQPEPALLFGQLGGSGITWQQSITRGDAVPGLIRPFLAVFPTSNVDVAGTGRWAAAAGLDEGGTPRPAFIADGVGAGESGAPSPAGPDWAEVPSAFYRVAVNGSGLLARAGVLDTGGPSPVGAVFLDDDPIYVEGQPLAGTSDVVGTFSALEVEVTESDELVCVVPTTNAVRRLRAGNETLIRTFQTTAESGETVTALLDRFDASSDGSTIACVGQLGFSGPYALLLVERSFDGPNLCTTVPNSTGQAGRLSFVGSRWIQVNDFSVRASDLPPDQFGLLLNGTGGAFVPNPGGSDGNLCLGGTLGRHNASIQSSGPAGEILFPTDLGAIPQPSQFLSVTSGTALRFQVWHRDGSATSPSSNFTEARRVRFL